MIRNMKPQKRSVSIDICFSRIVLSVREVLLRLLRLNLEKNQTRSISLMRYVISDVDIVARISSWPFLESSGLFPFHYSVQSSGEREAGLD